MANYRLSKEAKEDLIRIHHYGVEQLESVKLVLYCFERDAPSSGQSILEIDLA